MKALLAAALFLSGCGYVSFGRKISDDEMRLRDDVRGYYDEVVQAFAAGNPDALALLFDVSIAKPMTRPQILDWGRKFFGEHGPARFKVEKVEFERLGYENAVVLLTYRVETRSGKGGFGGVERDVLVKRGRRWTMTEWEVVSPPKKPAAP